MEREMPQKNPENAQAWKNGSMLIKRTLGVSKIIEQNRAQISWAALEFKCQQ